MDWRTFRIPPCPTCLLQGRTEINVRTCFSRLHAPTTVAHPPRLSLNSSSLTWSSLASQFYQKSRLARMSSTNIATSAPLNQIIQQVSRCRRVRKITGHWYHSCHLFCFSVSVSSFSSLPSSVLTNAFSFPDSIVLCNMH